MLLDDCVLKGTLKLPLAAELFLSFSAFHVPLVSFKNYFPYNSPVQLTNHCDVTFITTFALPPMWAATCFSYLLWHILHLAMGMVPLFYSFIAEKHRSFASFFCGYKSCMLALAKLSTINLKTYICPRCTDVDVCAAERETLLPGSLAWCCYSSTLLSGNHLCEHWVYSWKRNLRLFFSY